MASLESMSKGKCVLIFLCANFLESGNTFPFCLLLGWTIIAKFVVFSSFGVFDEQESKDIRIL